MSATCTLTVTNTLVVSGTLFEDSADVPMKIRQVMTEYLGKDGIVPVPLFSLEHQDVFDYETLRKQDQTNQYQLFKFVMERNRDAMYRKTTICEWIELVEDAMEQSILNNDLEAFLALNYSSLGTPRIFQLRERAHKLGNTTIVSYLKGIGERRLFQISDAGILAKCLVSPENPYELLTVALDEDPTKRPHVTNVHNYIAQCFPRVPKRPISSDEFTEYITTAMIRADNAMCLGLIKRLLKVVHNPSQVYNAAAKDQCYIAMRCLQTHDLITKSTERTNNLIHHILNNTMEEEHVMAGSDGSIPMLKMKNEHLIKSIKNVDTMKLLLQYDQIPDELMAKLPYIAIVREDFDMLKVLLEYRNHFDNVATVCAVASGGAVYSQSKDQREEIYSLDMKGYFDSVGFKDLAKPLIDTLALNAYELKELMIWAIKNKHADLVDRMCTNYKLTNVRYATPIVEECILAAKQEGTEDIVRRVLGHVAHSGFVISVLEMLSRPNLSKAYVLLDAYSVMDEEISVVAKSMYDKTKDAHGLMQMERFSFLTERRSQAAAVASSKE